MQTFKDMIEERVQHGDAEDLREAIIDFYIVGTDLFEDDTDDSINENVGLEIISELADIFTPSQITTIMEKLVEASGIDDEYLQELALEEDDDGENDEDEIDEKRFKVIKQKAKRKLKLKAKAKGKVGKEKTASAAFRAKKVFDPKRKRFVIRKKVRSIAAQKKMDRKFTKRMTRRRKARGG